ncbi:hypothetical protein LshimejAT787_0311930 [Lyophyllum shimeji]|uniref:Uncharacterized protein n=1 Tax=Lyophyllum shimeji TaxID=47721 RepID=A0A9P3PJH9_LYOSH|nr:hypothetical protein LshimejAT787_0311930 [Lyophyllum shimeji]
MGFSMVFRVMELVLGSFCRITLVQKRNLSHRTHSLTAKPLLLGYIHAIRCTLRALKKHAIAVRKTLFAKSDTLARKFPPISTQRANRDPGFT